MAQQKTQINDLGSSKGMLKFPQLLYSDDKDARKNDEIRLYHICDQIQSFKGEFYSIIFTRDIAKSVNYTKYSNIFYFINVYLGKSWL